MHDIVVIGASAGGVEALSGIVGRLSPNLKAAVFVVVHISPDSTGLLPSVLNRHSALAVQQAADGAIEPGNIYVAPPDRHLILENDEMRVVQGPKHNRYRPSIDLLFRTAARNFGARVIGVVLTGFLDDGSSGLLAIQNGGGITIVQDPDDAQVASMPRSALLHVQPNYCVPARQIGELINRLVDEEEMEKPVMVARKGNGGPGKIEKRKTQTSFTCPDCNGTIWEVNEHGEIRFECRVGHAYSPEAMREAADEGVERSLWIALRALEETAALDQRLADLSAHRKRENAHSFYRQKAHDRKRHAAVLREFLLGSKQRKTEVEGDEGKEELERVS